MTAASAVAAVASSAEPGEISARRAEVEQVLAQIQELDASLSHAVEDYNAANVRLDEIEEEQELNQRTLRVARRNLVLQQRAVARRLVAFYSSDADLSGLGVILGATSLADFVSRLDTINTAGRQDLRIAREVKRFKKAVEAQKRRLEIAHERQADLVAARAAARTEIENRLAERRALVASIKSEIERLEAREGPGKSGSSVRRVSGWRGNAPLSALRASGWPSRRRLVRVTIMFTSIAPRTESAAARWILAL